MSKKRTVRIYEVELEVLGDEPKYVVVIGEAVRYGIVHRDSGAFLGAWKTKKRAKEALKLYRQGVVVPLKEIETYGLSSKEEAWFELDPSAGGFWWHYRTDLIP